MRIDNYCLFFIRNNVKSDEIDRSHNNLFLLLCILLN